MIVMKFTVEEKIKFLVDVFCEKLVYIWRYYVDLCNLSILEEFLSIGLKMI